MLVPRRSRERRAANGGVSFGSYYPGDSAIHRLDPRTKLLLGFVFLITTLTVGSFRGLVPVAIFVVLIYTVSRLPARRVLSSMAPLLAIVAVVAVLNLFSDQSGRILWQLGFLQISEGRCVPLPLWRAA